MQFLSCELVFMFGNKLSNSDQITTKSVKFWSAKEKKNCVNIICWKWTDLLSSAIKLKAEQNTQISKNSSTRKLQEVGAKMGECSAIKKKKKKKKILLFMKSREMWKGDESK